MKPDEARILAAIDRNLEEADNAILKLTAYNSLNKLHSDDSKISFFTIVDQALYNDMLAGAIRIFDEHKEAGSFWYIVRCHEPVARKLADRCGIDLARVRTLVPKLRHIRNKTHFHIDRKALDNPSSVWSDADISGHELSDALHAAALLLREIRHAIYGGNRQDMPAYDGSDIAQIIAAYRNHIAVNRHTGND